VRAPRGGWARLGWAAAFAVGGVLLYVAYADQSTRSRYVNSDGASNALQAWDMLHGNVLLSGWALTDVSFYTTDLPQYVLVEALRGLGPEAVHLAAALTYTVLVLLAGWLAKGRATGAEGVARVLTAAGIMLAPQLGSATAILLLSPDHLGTCVPLLVTWLVIDRAEDPGWLNRNRALVPVATVLLLAWTAIGDPLAEVIGALPLAVVCGARAIRGVTRGLEPRGHEPARQTWYHLSLAVAAVASAPVAWAATRLISGNGGWTQSAVRTGFAGSGVLWRNASLTGEGLLQLFGADVLGQPSHRALIFAVVHLIGLALVAVALVLAIRGFLTADLLVPVLAVGIVVNIAAYLFSVQAQDIARTREIVAVLPYGAVLAGRLLGSRIRFARLAAPMALVLAVYTGMLVSNAVQPRVPDQTAKLASWLAKHDLTRGLAGYWQANSVTLDSRGVVTVRPVTSAGGKVIAAAYWDARKDWYEPATHYASFLVDIDSAATGHNEVLLSQLAAVAGRPAEVYQVGPYTVAVWHENLLKHI